MQTLFTTKEAHEQLRVSMPTIRSWIHQGRLPVVRLGRRVFIHESVLEKIIREGLDSVDKNPWSRINFTVLDEHISWQQPHYKCPTGSNWDCTRITGIKTFAEGSPKMVLPRTRRKFFPCMDRVEPGHMFWLRHHKRKSYRLNRSSDGCQGAFISRGSQTTIRH